MASFSSDKLPCLNISWLTTVKVPPCMKSTSMDGRRRRKQEKNCQAASSFYSDNRIWYDLADHLRSACVFQLFKPPAESLNFDFVIFILQGSGNDNMYTLPRTPVLALEDESDNFCSASQLRKSHSIDASTYLYEEANSAFAEAVNPKINANAGQMTIDRNGGGGGGNLSKSKSEYNLAFGSPTRSGTCWLLQSHTRHAHTLRYNLIQF